MTSQTSSLNTAIKNGKQANNRKLQKIVEYTKKESYQIFQIKKVAKLMKQSRTH